MADFRCDGLDSLLADMRALAELPDEVVDGMLNAGADVVVEAQKRKIRSYGIYATDNQATKHVADSVKKTDVKLQRDARVIYVYPQGTRRRGKSTTRNAEIAFINEYGKQGQKARPAIRDANEECAESTTAAQAKVDDEWLTSKNL